MLYYQALDDSYDYFTKHYLIRGELVTPKERDTKYRYIADSLFRPIELSKNKTYKSFGARFANHDTLYNRQVI